MGATIDELAALLSLKDREPAPLNDFWEMREAMKRRETEREAMRIDAASLARRVFQQDEPQIIINIFIGENHGD
jgi:hypothetical protein